MPRDWRDDRIDELEGRILQLERMVSERDDVIAKLMGQLAAAMARITKLEEQVRRSSKNSSQPPSSDGPSMPPRSKERTGRHPGGQEGHARHDRPLIPPDKVSKRITVRPEQCKGCHLPLLGLDPSPRRHQVIDIPPMTPIVTEYEIHSLDCLHCGTQTTAALPPGVPTGIFAPSVVAMVATMMGVYRVSKRAVAELMGDVFGVSMSVGAVIGCQTMASAALATPYEEAKTFIAKQPVRYADETSWRENRKRAFLWCAVTPRVTVFQVHARRNTVAAQALLGGHEGIVITDRHGAYNFWSGLKRQFCWAHLIRDFRKIAERDCDSGRIGEALLGEAKRLFTWWQRVRDGTLLRSTFAVYMRSVQRSVMRLLVEGERVFSSKTAKTCKKILSQFDSLWTFVRIEGVEPTNNTAERAVRHAVLYRKASYGTHCQNGSRFIERILSVHASLRQQQRSILQFVRDACHASLHQTTAPSFLPVSEKS
jgi:transposase